MSPFQEYFIDVIKYKYADFSGRARRSEYWYYTLFSILTVFALCLLTIPLVAMNKDSSFVWIPFVLIGIFYVAIMIPSFAVLTRRLHDSGKSGWFILLSFVPLGSFVLLIFTFLEGEQHTNKWGPNPKNPSLQNTAAEHLLEDDIV